MKLCFLIFFLLVSAETLAEEVKYDDHKVYRIIPNSYEEIEGLHSLSKREADVSFC